MANTFVLTTGPDTFTGLAGDDNIFELDPTTLQSTDTVTGGAAGAFHDFLVVTAGGTLTASQFSGVTNIEEINLAAAGNTVALANGLVAGNSIGYFAVVDGGGDDNVDASGITNSTAIAFYISGGTDTLTGGNGNDAFIFTGGATLSAADTLIGGTGNDTIYIGGAGPLAASAFDHVSGVEGLVLSDSAGHSVTLTNALVASSDIGYFGVTVGSGVDTVDASGITNNIGVVFSAGSANETFKGGNGNNAFVFAPTQLAATDTVQGGSGIDNLYLTAAGTVAASAFANVTGIEGLVLANGTNNITLADSIDTGSSIGYLAVLGGTGNDTVDGSGITNNIPIAFFGTTGGNDTFTGGNGNDSFLFAAGTLNLNDFVAGGSGSDTLWMTTAGTVNTGDLIGVSGIEGVYQQSGGTFHFSNGITGAATLAAVGSSAVDTFDGSAVTGYGLVFTGNGGADVLTGGSGDDVFNIPDSAFAQIDGNGGLDRIVLTTPGQSFNLTANASKITDTEIISLSSSAAASLTLAGSDIPLINAVGNLLYVVGGSDDLVDAGSGWFLISTTHTNAAVAPGVNFIQYHNASTGSELYVADQIALTIGSSPSTFSVTALSPAAGVGNEGTGAPTDFTFQVNLTAPAVGDTTYNYTVAGTGGSPANAADFVSTSGSIVILNGQSSGVITIQVVGDANVEPDEGFQVTATFGAESHAASGTIVNDDVNTPPVANDDSVSATEKGGLNNAVAGVNPSGNLVTGTGAAGAVADTDTQDPSSALTVAAVGTGVEGSADNGTVGTGFAGAHGTLTLNSDGSYTYLVNQTDTAVQGLHTSADTLSDVFHYTVQDTGALQDSATFTVTIHGANDLPLAVADTGSMGEDDAATTFAVRANDTLDPDSTAANTVVPGSVTVTNTPAGTTFVNGDATAAAVDSNHQIQVTLGAAFQQLRVGETVTVTVPYTLTGDAGDTSSANLVVTVNGANDVPIAVDDTPASITEDQVGTFTVRGNDTLDADHGAANSVTTGTVTNLVAPAGEGIDVSDIGVAVNGSNQVVVTLGADFQHMTDGETTTFDIPYTLHGDQAGDTSDATVHVTVNGANDAPVAATFTFNGANSANYNTDLVVNDPTDGAPDPAGPQKTISGDLLAGATDVDTPLSSLIVVAGTITTTDGGKVLMQADGDFTYTPKVGTAATTDSFTYTVSDQNPGTPGLGNGTVNLTLQGPHIWYVDDSAAAGGDGSSEKPFNSLTPLNGAGGAGDVDGAGDIIFLYNGTYSGGLVLENNQQLISQSQGLVVADGGGGAGTVTLEAATGSNSVINGTVTLASGNTIKGIDFGNVSGFALQDSGATVGTATVANSSINNTTGGAVNIANGGTLAMDFTSVSSTGAAASALALANTSGTFHAHAGTLSNATGADVSLTGNHSGDDVNFTYDGSISDATGTAVAISDQSGGTKDFNGSITGATISLSGNNAGATMSFDGGMTLSAGASNAFSATSGGTLTVTGTNHLTTTTGTALNISNTTIGTGNVTFQDISSGSASNSAADGIILDTTGSSGGLHVTGNGANVGASGGGVIQHKTGADGSTTQGTGIYLNSTSDVQLNGMQLNDFQNYGIRGINVTGFTLDHSNIDGTNGTSNLADSDVNIQGEGSVRFTNLLGSAAISNSTLDGGVSRTLLVFNNAVGSSLDRLTVSNSTIKDTLVNALTSDAMFVGATNNAIVNFTVTNSTFTAGPQALIDTSALGTSTMDIVIDHSHFSNSNSLNASNNLILNGGGTDTLVTFDINNNDFRQGAAGSGTAPSNGGRIMTAGMVSGAGKFDGKFVDNTIGVNGVNFSGGGNGADGIGIFASGNHAATTRGTGTTDSRFLIQGNDIQHYGQTGIQISAAQGNSTLDATVLGNTIHDPGTPAGGAFAAIWVNSGALGGDTSVVNVAIGGTAAADKNTLTNSDPNNVDDVFLDTQTDAGALTFINLYRNGSTASGSLSEALIRQILVDDNIGPLDLLNGFTNGSPPVCPRA